MKIVKKIIITILVIALGGIYAYGIWERPIYDTDIGSNSYAMTSPIDKEVRQSFECPQNGLTGINIKVNFTNEEYVEKYNWKLLDEQGKIVEQGTFYDGMLDEALFVKKKILSIGFPKLENSKGELYTFIIENTDVQGENNLMCYMTSENERAMRLLVDNNEMDQALIIKQQVQMFSVETFVVFIGLMCYILLFVKCMYRLFR